MIGALIRLFVTCQTIITVQPNMLAGANKISDTFITLDSTNVTMASNMTNRECKSSLPGLDYDGVLSNTVSGKRCLMWAEGLNYTELPSNLCRNQDSSMLGPWCYIQMNTPHSSTPTSSQEPILTSNTSWEYCPVPICDVSDAINEILVRHIGETVIRKPSDYTADTIMMYFPPIMLVFGTICNILVCTVFSRPLTTTTFILVVLAITDTMALHMGIWVQWLKVLFRQMQIPNFMEARSDFTCKIFNYFYYTVSTFTVWILVIVTIERLVAVTQPHQNQIMFTRKCVCILLMGALLGISLLNLPYWYWIKAKTTFYYGLKDGRVYIDAYCNTTPIYMFWIDSSVRVVIPFIIMLISNITIIVTIYNAHKNRHFMAPSSIKSRKQLKYVTVLLLSVTFLHLVLTIPALISLLVHLIYGQENINLWYTVVWCFVYVDQSINFLVYSISWSKVRRTFLSMIGYQTGNSVPQRIVYS